jgi:hypothetical protein
MSHATSVHPRRTVTATGIANSRAGLQRDHDVEGLLRQIDVVRLRALHPLLRYRPNSVLEIDLIPGSILQLAFAHHGLQIEAHAEPDGWQRRHLLELLEHDPDLSRRERPVLRYECRDRSRTYVVSRIGDLLAVQNREAVNLFDDVTDVDRSRRRAPLDDSAAVSPQVIWRDFRQKPISPHG